MKFLYAMKLVPPKDLGSIVHPGTWHYPLGVLTLGTVTGNHVAHTDFFFLKATINEHVFMILVLVCKKYKISTLGNFEIWLDCACDLN